MNYLWLLFYVKPPTHFRDSTNKYEVLAKMTLSDSNVTFLVFVVAVVVVFWHYFIWLFFFLVEWNNFNKALEKAEAT